VLGRNWRVGPRENLDYPAFYEAAPVKPAATKRTVEFLDRADVVAVLQEVGCEEVRKGR
jgi:hypothetical protein